MQFHFLYGSESGTAEVLAEDFSDEIQSDHNATCENIEDVDVDIFSDKDSIYIFFLATYGEGDYTISAEDFFEDLENQSPDLSGFKYAMFGLGDRSYEDSYNFASKNADALLTKLGASRVGPIGEFDASSGELPEDMAAPWMQDILKKATS